MSRHFFISLRSGVNPGSLEPFFPEDCPDSVRFELLSVFRIKLQKAVGLPDTKENRQALQGELNRICEDLMRLQILYPYFPRGWGVNGNLLAEYAMDAEMRFRLGSD